MKVARAMLTEKFNLTQPVRQESLSSQVFGILKEAIFSGKFQPGETLRELHLAKMFDVSQATIREALVQLEHSGLVVRLQNRKTSVTSLTPHEVRDRLDMRLVLEDVAFRKAAQNFTDGDVATLRDIAETIHAAIEAGNYAECTAADMRFHEFVWERSGSPILKRTLEQLTTPLFAFTGVLQARGMTDLRRTKSHDVLIQALASGNPSAAAEAIKDHISGSYSAFLESGAVDMGALAPAEAATA